MTSMIPADPREAFLMAAAALLDEAAAAGVHAGMRSTGLRGRKASLLREVNALRMGSVIAFSRMGLTLDEARELARTDSGFHLLARRRAGDSPTAIAYRRP